MTAGGDIAGAAIAQVQPLSPMQQMAAGRLQQVHQETARVTIFGDADVDDLVAVRARINGGSGREDGARVTFTHLIVKAVADALQRHPRINACLSGKELRQYADINIGIAVALPNGDLTVPVLHRASLLPLAELAAATRALMEKAVTGKLGLSDVRGGTFTVSNAGMVPHVRWTTPIMVPGQTAILGVGALAQRPTVHGGRVEARWNIPLSLSFDHRAVNGDPASRFLSDVIDLLADPDGGWLENS